MSLLVTKVKPVLYKIKSAAAYADETASLRTVRTTFGWSLPNASSGFCDKTVFRLDLSQNRKFSSEILPVALLGCLMESSVADICIWTNASNALTPFSGHEFDWPK